MNIEKNFDFIPPDDELNEDLLNISFDEPDVDDIFQCGRKKSRRKIYLL